MTWLKAIFSVIPTLFAGLFGIIRSSQINAVRKVEVQSRDEVIKGIERENTNVTAAMDRRKRRNLMHIDP